MSPWKCACTLRCAASAYWDARRLKSAESAHHRKQEQRILAPALVCGAGDGARTRYLHLGKVALYQMSYARIMYDPDVTNHAAHGPPNDPVVHLHLHACTDGMVPPVGIEPTTRGFSVRCSTN